MDEIDSVVGALEATSPESALDQATVARLLSLRREVKAIERMLKRMKGNGAQVVRESTRNGLASVFEHTALVELLLIRMVTSSSPPPRLPSLPCLHDGDCGIYGINVRIVPELAWDYGYQVVLASMLLVPLILYWRFRRSGWL